MSALTRVKRATRSLVTGRKRRQGPRVQDGDGFQMVGGRNFRVVRSKTQPDAASVGIYLRGACDLPAIFTIAPMLNKDVNGTLTIKRDPILISGSRSDVLLQTLEVRDSAPPEALQEASRKLQLGPRYFSSDFFDPTFTLETDLGEQTVDKSIVVLSAAPDFARTLYRHREHGFLVDPGGFWLNHSIDNALNDLDTVKWFNKTYKSIGRFTPDEYVASFTRLVEETKARTGAHIVVVNMLTVDPSSPIHNYRLIKEADGARRREFVIKLAEMSQRLDFDVVDVDRILKLDGVDHLVDFAHFSPEQFRPIGAEALRILRARDLL